MSRRSRALILTCTALIMASCDSSTPGNPDVGGGDRGPATELGQKETSAGDLAKDTTVLPPDKGPCTPTMTSCTGYCGVVWDKCTGKEWQCGGCPAGDVCNIETHACNKALTTCTQLGAECGTIKNSCGTHIDCGTCPAGKECDPDTNRCVTCQNVTCKDLGYECGSAWLGCGPLSNTTDCGTCAGGKKCNTAYNLCEPTCTPQPAATLCASAKTASGVECGTISDGCGGLVDCGKCPAGKGCGVAGVANRCEKLPFADECIVLGKNCGTLTSVCGGTLDCGTCQNGEVCNSNGVCGPPCKPKVCADFAPDACGTYDDGCKGTLSCTCPGSGAICLATKTPHECCTNTTICPAGSCATTVTNSCTGAPIACNTCNSSTEVCDTAQKKCVAKKSCASYAAGTTVNGPCNDYSFYDIGNGTKIPCPCQIAGKTTWCINDSATVAGTCCENQGKVCPAVGQPGSCGGKQVTNTCTGQVTTCTCPWGYHCEGDTCKPNLNCQTYNATGGDGAPCSNGPAFDNGGGTLFACPCGSGFACLDAGGAVVTGSAVGNCKKKKTCADYSATGGNNAPCSNDPSSAFPDDVGGKLECNCSSGYACADGSNNVVSGDTTGTCKPKKTCANYTTGAQGAQCNPNPFFDDGFGGKLACNCNTSGGWGNITCSGATASQAGTCSCAPKTCTCGISGQSNGCGGTLSCACQGGKQCNAATGACCDVYNCTTRPPGIGADACGAIPNTCLGTTFPCTCPTGGTPPWTYNKCSVSSGMGTCTCTPDTCAKLGSGVFDDGCGKKITCGG